MRYSEPKADHRHGQHRHGDEDEAPICAGVRSSLPARAIHTTRSTAQTMPSDREREQQDEDGRIALRAAAWRSKKFMGTGREVGPVADACIVLRTCTFVRLAGGRDRSMRSAGMTSELDGGHEVEHAPVRPWLDEGRLRACC